MQILFAVDVPEDARMEIDESLAAAWSGFSRTISATMEMKMKAKMPIQILAPTVFLFPLNSGAEILSYLVQACAQARRKYKIGLLKEPVEWTTKS